VSKKLDAVAAIKAAIPQRRSMKWQDRVSPEHAETLRNIREAFDAGEFGTKRKPAYIAIATYLNEQDISTVGHQGVREWLEKR